MDISGITECILNMLLDITIQIESTEVDMSGTKNRVYFSVLVRYYFQIE